MAEPLAHRLLAHEFMIEAISAPHNIEAKLSERSLQTLRELQLEPLYGYVQQVFLHLSGLLSAIDRLDHAALFITSFSPSKRMQEAGITRRSQLQHAIEDYIVRTASVYDRALVVVNTVCALGINPRSIDDRSVRKRSAQVGPAIIASLDGLKATLTPYRQDRHAIIHRESYSDKELQMLDHIELWVNLRKRGFDFELDEHTEFGVVFLPALTRDYARRKYREFVATNFEICGKLEALLDALRPSYRAHVSLLQEGGL